MSEHLQRSVPALCVMVGALVLLGQQATDDVWAAAAHFAYTAFLLLLIGLAVFAWLVGAGRYRRTARRIIPLLAILSWLLLAGMMVVAAYVPSGWNLWNRALLVGMVGLLTWALLHGSTALRLHSGLLTATVTLALMIFLTYGLDRGVGLVTGGREPGGLVFPRNSRVTYQTPEFRYTAQVNRYGFRGPNVDLAAPVDCRVMLVGDSFTYGWGVDYEQTWAALLEDHLQTADIAAQVLNLGAPGANVPDYAVIAREAAPILQPDVILVGVLQGDDMRQMSREAAPFPRGLTFGDDAPPSPLTEYLTFHYPHIAERTVLARISERNVQRNWQATAARFTREYQTRDDWLARYRSTELTVRDYFLNGQISPHFLHFAIVMPDYWVWPLQAPDALAPYINLMTEDFAQVAAAARDAETVIVSVPHGAYTQPEARDDLERMGFIMPPEIVESSLVDDAIEQAASLAGLPFLKVTDVFRQHEPLAFYPLDGHFNAEGNRLFAEAIAPTVVEYCRN